jgi:hypothetical protein
MHFHITEKSIGYLSISTEKSIGYFVSNVIKTKNNTVSLYCSSKNILKPITAIYNKPVIQ